MENITEKIKNNIVWHIIDWSWGKTVVVISSDASGLVKMSIDNDTPNKCYISLLSVVAEKRRTGIATHLMQICEDYCRRNGISRIDLDCIMDDWLVQFYERIGFSVVEKDEDIIRMSKTLNDK